MFYFNFLKICNLFGPGWTSAGKLRGSEVSKRVCTPRVPLNVQIPVLCPAWGVRLEETGLCIRRPVSWRGDNSYLQVWKVPSPRDQARSILHPPTPPIPASNGRDLGLHGVYLGQVFLALRMQVPVEGSLSRSLCLDQQAAGAFVKSRAL